MIVRRTPWVAVAIPMLALLLSLAQAFGMTATRASDSQPSPQTSLQPNIVFVIADDVSPDDLGIYGNPDIKTPALGLLAENGLVFDNAYLTISSCSPSRCSIITGRYPHNTGAPELHTTLPTDQTTLAELLRDAGYHTILSGKNHMGKPQTLGFDSVSNGSPSGCEKWVQELRQRPTDKPFFAWFASHDAHHPWAINDTAPTFDPDTLQLPSVMAEGPKNRSAFAGYAHEVARCDVYLGHVIAELQKQSILENTYILFCADNGRPFPRCKSYLYDSGIKTPLVIRGPGVATGRTSSLVSSVDLMPTMLRMAGISKPRSVQGVDLTSILHDPTSRVRDVAYAERNWHVFQNHSRAVRFGPWLYVWNAYPNRHGVSGETANYKYPFVKEFWQLAQSGKLRPELAAVTFAQQPREQLFHVTNDPNQFDNLATQPQYAATLKRARRLLESWTKETADCLPDDPTPDRDQLHSSKKASSKPFRHRELPGQRLRASYMNRPGPVELNLN
ncbi:MAG: sulfatase [Planctomycetota bacterium]